MSHMIHNQYRTRNSGVAPVFLRRMRLMHHLYQSPIININAVASLLDINHNTATDLVGDLSARACWKRSPAGGIKRLRVQWVFSGV